MPVSTHFDRNSALALFPPFVPHALLRGAHRMTVASKLPRETNERFERLTERRVFDVDAETRVLALVNGHPHHPHAPVLLIVHGMTGGAASPYIRSTASKAWGLGFRTVRLNIRSCGGTEGWGPKLYHSGLTVDIRSVVHELIERDGVRELHLGGYSLGGNMLLMTLAEWGRAVPAEVTSCVAVSPSLELAESQRRLDEEPLLRPYRKYYLDGLKHKLRVKAHAFPGRFDVQGLESIRTLRAFDERYTAPLSGFHDADDYYAKASSGPRLPHIQVPTLLLHARDDFVVPVDVCERPWVREHPLIEVYLTAQGGHFGFISSRRSYGPGRADPDRFWAENRLVQYAAHAAGLPRA